jgi:putative endopeptidase
MAAFYKYAVTLFSLIGNDNPLSSAEAALKIETRLAKVQRDPALPIDYVSEYKKYDIARLKELFPNVDMDAILNLSGLKPESRYYVTDRRLMSAFAEIYSEDNLKALKAYAMFKLTDICAETLSQPFCDARNALVSDVMGTPVLPDPVFAAKECVKSIMHAYLGEIYVEKYLPQAAIREVESMVRTLVDMYKIRIDKLNWMEKETRASAKNKLDKMRIKVGAPPAWTNVMDTVNIEGPAEGGTYFKNMTAYFKSTRAMNARKQGKAVNADGWDVSVFTVNAFYRPNANEIVLPAGLLQYPFYVHGGPKEANLGGIGCVIAHELTHAIDFHGAQFDENGNAGGWWTEGDKERYAVLSAKAAAHYDGYESAPGILVDGERTVCENIADLGMVACALSAAQKLPNPDFNLFFTSAAKIWASTSTRKALEVMAQTGSHCPENARVNKTFQNFQEFHAAFNIEPGDSMYIAPETRLRIW